MSASTTELKPETSTTTEPDGFDLDVTLLEVVTRPAWSTSPTTGAAAPAVLAPPTSPDPRLQASPG
jgi:hypothetical protein